MSSPERTSSSFAAAAAVVTPKISAAKKKKTSAKKPRPTAAEAAERRRLRLEAQGENSIFNRGQHRGKTFAEVAKLDPVIMYDTCIFSTERANNQIRF